MHASIYGRRSLENTQRRRQCHCHPYIDARIHLCASLFIVSHAEIKSARFVYLWNIWSRVHVFTVTSMAHRRGRERRFHPQTVVHRVSRDHGLEFGRVREFHPPKKMKTRISPSPTAPKFSARLQRRNPTNRCTGHDPRLPANSRFIGVQSFSTDACINVSFWCPVLVQVRTNTRDIREEISPKLTHEQFVKK